MNRQSKSDYYPTNHEKSPTIKQLHTIENYIKIIE